MASRLENQRKYTAFWGALIIASGMLAFSKITGDHWVDFGGMVFMAYMAGNVGEHFSKRSNNQ